jgi:polysaccharide export outer membrane protein
MRLLLLSTLALLLVRPAAGSAQQVEPPPARDAGKPAVTNVSQDYVIGPEDVLDIAVWNNTAMSRTVPVRPDGKISLPILNDVEAAGLTPMQLREVLEQALVRYISVPEVSVIVKEVNSFRVSVVGEVKTPGRYELKSRATVLELLAMAGGLTEYADRGRIVVIRQTGGTTRQIAFDYGKLTSRSGGTNGHDNPFVQPGDIILVP